ncbi:MarR family winged helix-turn-helix transcriptional regulator [Pseudosulfitobacter pseudonitzschiae]|uniref:MarR family winged helix-turn-helix transcriptional regulator n=1 Tax=Pseudosulfitobacter pseudonitzschiae TaxID=1402135 RepID=UPI001AFC0CD1|nr:MarR family winged helix-turn-helix transcriptional regulator [Pseudosulfitobacter pseudonitzschiae]MBM1817273.1 winged helix-turn-helix transcriptional regulator [Pseudosulfitobacter pseudonitzschiae]MBM1834284.1 winged helix-turn-helix transcriptional regulator [Pseudosulfitobacter pseudonitzschiae]MBM1839149.1 winged helix-turn-helix transcriptional regulator [Pseudosulfitobacter pseudonitzschiae]MBM1843998.1 winged helix-turn-helix transcriptional regulator [Pseudosulfitobacter pseudonit
MSKNRRIFHKLQIAHSALFRAADHRTRDQLGLTTSQLAVLFILSRTDGQPISKISNTLAMGKSSLTGLVDRMCAKGLVRRSPSKEDGRVINIYLEQLGRNALEQGARETSQFNTALLAPFSVAEQDIIERFLTHLATNADDIINGSSPTKKGDAGND